MNKRKLQAISPAKPAPSKKIATSDMDTETIRTIMQETLNENLKDIKQTLKEVVKLSDLEKLHGEIKHLQDSNQILTEKVTALEERCEMLEDRMVAGQMRDTEGNLIFHLLKENLVEPKAQIQTICLCRTHGKTTSTLSENNIIAIRSNNSESSNFLVRLGEKTTAINILRASKSLKDAGIVIRRDYPLPIRQKRSHLIEIRKTIKAKNPRIDVFLRDDRLLVQGKVFTWSFKSGLMYGKYNGNAMLDEIINNTNHMDVTGPAGIHEISAVSSEPPGSESTAKAFSKYTNRPQAQANSATTSQKSLL